MNIKLKKLTPELVKKVVSNSKIVSPINIPVVELGDRLYSSLRDEDGNFISYSIHDHLCYGGKWEEQWQLLNFKKMIKFTYTPGDCSYIDKPSKRYEEADKDNKELKAHIDNMLQEAVQAAMEAGQEFYYGSSTK